MRSGSEQASALTQRAPAAHIFDVYDFWNVEACGSHFISAEKGTSEFYEKFRAFRYQTEWHIPLLVPFSETKGKAVLEIGCGNGADGAMFALSGANYTGVDLTVAAVEATRAHFQSLGLSGRFRIENAERLSFANESFEFVYSYGVLHHTANPNAAFDEVFRVLKPGGRAILMLYHKHSFNYYVRILGYMRARVMLHSLLRVAKRSSDRISLRNPILEMRGNAASGIWRAHYENLLRYGWSYLRADNFVHHATDGPECPIAHVYTRKLVHHLFRKFSRVETRVAHFPLRKHSATRWVPFVVERQLSSKMGWYLLVYLTK